MRAEEFLPDITLGKLEKTGQVVQLIKHADQVGFSDESGWLLINIEPGKKSGPSGLVKWIPDSTRFTWVKKYRGNEQLDELSFLGSPCTKDCSGHRAGYDWSKARGDVDEIGTSDVSIWVREVAQILGA